MGDIPVEALFPAGRECFELGSSGWPRVLGIDAVGGPPHRDFADEGGARVTSRWCPDWLGVTLAGVILDLVGDVSPIAATSTPVTAPIGCSRGQISTRLSRLLAAGWSRCRQRCSTCFGTTLKLSVQRRTAAQLWVDEGWIFSDEIGRALNPRTDWDHWKKLLKAAGVRDGRLHDARHTAATVLLLLGVHERTIMSVLGWSTTAMVSRYAHVVAPIHSDVASRLDVLLWSSPNSATNDRNVAR